MSQSLSKLYVHIIFHVKNERMQICPEEEKELYAYIGGIIKQNGSYVGLKRKIIIMSILHGKEDMPDIR
jgi:hypothetical protein